VNLKNHPDTQYGLMFGAISNTRPTLVCNVHVCMENVKQVHNLSLHVNNNNKITIIFFKNYIDNFLYFYNF
jgi:hypothetical protein